MPIARKSATKTKPLSDLRDETSHCTVYIDVQQTYTLSSPTLSLPTILLVMRSVTRQDPSIPTVYCQRTEHNEVLGSLMSSVFQRNVRSKRFDRNQERHVSTSEQSIHGVMTTRHVPQGGFISNILIVVLGDAVLESLLLTTIGTNRGHCVLGVQVSQACKWTQVR